MYYVEKIPYDEVIVEINDKVELESSVGGNFESAAAS
jgi:hypothetical protein